MAINVNGQSDKKQQQQQECCNGQPNQPFGQLLQNESFNKYSKSDSKLSDPCIPAIFEHRLGLRH